MNKQEIFDKVVVHLATQGKRAMHGDDCQYRTPDGLKCAVGCVLPDDLYNPEMDSPNGSLSGISEVAKRYPEVKAYFGKDNITFLSKLQMIHDYRRKNSLFESLKNLAEDYDLDTTILDEYELLFPKEWK